MPTLSVYIGSSNITSVYFKEGEEPKHFFYPYSYVPETENGKTELLSVIKENLGVSGESDVNVTWGDLFTTLFESADYETVSTIKTSSKSSNQNKEQNILYISRPCIVSGGKSIYAEPFFSSTLNDSAKLSTNEELNLLMNYSIYPFTRPYGETEVSNYDNMIRHLAYLRFATKNLQQENKTKATEAKELKKALSKKNNIVATGDRLALENYTVETYLLILDLIVDTGIFNVQFDDKNIYSAVKLLGKDISQSFPLKNLGTVVKMPGPVSCYLDTDVGTHQLIEVPENSLVVVPLQKENSGRVVLKSKEYESSEHQVLGGLLGFVVDTRNPSTYLGSYLDTSKMAKQKADLQIISESINRL